MTINGKYGRIGMLTAVLALSMLACSTTSYLKVTYALPAGDTAPATKTVFLKVTDNTGPAPFLGPEAREDLKHFSGLFSVKVAGKYTQPVLEGAYDIPGLFYTAFRERLTAAGISVMDTPGPGVPTLHIDLTAFQIDMAGRKWTTRLDYVAGMYLDDAELTTQTVSGSAERAKVIGVRDAEMLLGETVTTMVNRLDLGMLFGHPRL